VELSYALNNLGTLARKLGNTEEAIVHFKQSAELKRKVLAATPDDHTLRYDLIDTLSWISSEDDSQGRLKDAAEGYAEQIELLRALVADRPDAHAWYRRLANSLLRSARLSLAQGRVGEAQSEIAESVTRLTSLVDRQPENRIWRRDLAHAHMQAGMIERFRGEYDSARTHLQRAQRVSMTLLESTDSPPASRRLDALIRLHVAELSGASDERDRSLDRAIAELEQLATLAPSEVVGASVLASALITRGEIRQLDGQTDSAWDDWRQANRLLSPLVTRSKNRRVLAPWVLAHVLLGNKKAVESQIQLLIDSGYRHPEFLAVIAPKADMEEERNY